MTAPTELALRPAPPLIAHAPARGLFWDRLPVVADASTLISDCLRLARRERQPELRPPLLLTLSRDLPFIALYATEDVRREVEEHLPGAARGIHLSHQVVEQAWRESIAPAVRFVDLAPLPGLDPRIAALAAADPDDAPTGALAELLAPCLVLSSDPHLLEAGIARNDWGNLMTQAFEVGTLQMAESSTVLVMIMVGALAAEVGSAVVGAARRWPLVVLALGAGGAFLLYSYAQSERGGRHRADLRAFIADAWARLGPFLTRALECQRLLEQAAFVPDGQASDLAAVARVVASALHPPRASEVAARVGFTTQKATALLRKPVFVRTEDRRYLLGRSRAAAG